MHLIKTSLAIAMLTLGTVIAPRAMTLGLASSAKPMPSRRRTTTHVVYFYPSTVSQGSNGNSWSNLSSITASDDVRASVTAGTSNTLTLSGFGVSLPSNATVTGFSVVTEGYQVDPRYALYVVDAWVDLFGGSPLAQIGNEQDHDQMFSGAEPFPPGSPYTDEFVGFGSDTNPNSAWGTTISRSTLVDPNLTVTFNMDWPEDRSMYFDSISLKVTYTTP